MKSVGVCSFKVASGTLLQCWQGRSLHTAGHQVRDVATHCMSPYSAFATLLNTTFDPFHCQHCRCSSPASSCQNWTTATSLAPACPAAAWTVCSPDSWRAAPRPHHSAPCRPPLAAHTSAHSVQAVHTGLPVRSGVCTELPAERHLPSYKC